MTILDQGRPAAGFILSEGNGNISRENMVVARGVGACSPGQVMRDGAINIVTTGDTHTSTTLDDIADIAGLIEGVTYAVAGADIPADTTFVANGTDSVVLSHAATGTTNDLAITITKAAGELVKWRGTPDAATAILIDGVHVAASVAAAVPVAVVAREAEVKGASLVYPDGKDAEVRAALAAAGIIVRD